MSRCARCFGNIHDFAVFCPYCSQIREPDFDRLINQIIDDRYRIYRRLGQGGLSTVFVATDLQNDLDVVIKVSDPAQLARRDLSYSIEAEESRRYWDEMLERMRREAEALATIHHPNIVRFLGTGVIDDDLRYAAMEYLRGRTLRQEIDGKGRPSVAETIRIAAGISSALSEVHARGIIHRDINPRNIFLEYGTRNAERIIDQEQSAIRNPQSAIKLIDFGIAKFPQPAGAPPFTQHSTMRGTVAYTSPEQCQSRPIDHRADIYSFGVVLYEMLTGQRPFNGRTPTEIALKQIQAEPAPPRLINPDLPASMEKAVLRALKKNPDHRQQSVEELAGELQDGTHQIVITLQRSLEAETEKTIAIEGSDDHGLEERGKLARKRRRRLTLAVAASLIVIAATGIMLGRRSIISFSQPETEKAAAIDSPAPASSKSAEPGSSDSDADAMEIAARLSQTGSDMGNLSLRQITSPAPANMVAKASTSGDAAVLRGTASSNSPGSAGSAGSAATITPAPPNAKPKSPPAPQPTIAVTRIPQPSSEPEIDQAPRKAEGAIAQNRQPAERGGEVANGSRRPATPTAGNDRNGNGANDDNPQQIGPKIIQWSGAVDRERVVRIEMPGVPGTIEIPRVYRDRVGVIEPPSSSNGWGCAVLRVFGRGKISIIVRWWPIWRASSKFTALKR